VVVCAGVMPRSVFKQEEGGGCGRCHTSPALFQSWCTLLSLFKSPSLAALAPASFDVHPTLPPSLPSHFPHAESTIPEPDLAKPECYTLTTHDQQFGSDPIPMAVRSRNRGRKGGREECVHFPVDMWRTFPSPFFDPS